MKVIGKVDLSNITAEDRKKYYYSQKRKPIYDLQSCSCHFGYKCDEDIPLEARIVGWEDI